MVHYPIFKVYKLDGSGFEKLKSGFGKIRLGSTDLGVQEDNDDNDDYDTSE